MGRQSGMPGWVRLTARNISILPATSAEKDPAGGILVVVDDISQRKEAEELERNRAELQAIYDNAPVMMGLLNDDGVVSYANLALAEFVGSAPERLSARRICEVIGCIHHLGAPHGCGNQPGAACAPRQAILDTFSTGVPQRHIEYRTTLVLHGAPRTVVLRMDTALIPTADRSQLLLCLEDMTEHTRMETALMTAKDQAEAANRAKSTFLANMSHEIRTSLNAILGFAQILARDSGLNLAQRDSLHTIQRSGEHLLALFNDILDMARIEAGRMILQIAPFDLHRLIAEIDDLFRQRAHDRGLILRVERSDIPRWVAGDKARLRQILLNLVGNAVKFTIAGTVALRLKGDGVRDHIQFSVLDTGIGIAPDELPQIFKPFTQNAMNRTVQSGAGLGLPLSSQFVRLMGGELTVDSTPDQGSCFTFTLPFPAADSQESAAVHNPEPDLPLFQAAEGPATEPRLSPDVVAARLATHPTPWLTELKDAVEMGDFNRITGLLDQVRTGDAVLADTLAHWAYHYDLEAFSRALGVSPHAPQP